MLHFPRPQIDERLQIWDRALADPLPLDGDIDRRMLAQLDLTGAGIVNAAHTAALLAAESGASTVSLDHLFEGARRQFAREGRFFDAASLRRGA